MYNSYNAFLIVINKSICSLATNTQGELNDMYNYRDTTHIATPVSSNTKSYHTIYIQQGPTQTHYKYTKRGNIPTTTSAKLRHCIGSRIE